MKVDVHGKTINIGDTVAFGADNGSRLFTGKVYKLTPKKVWIHYCQPNDDYLVTYCRDYDRVSIVTEVIK